jgi:hypothetical protein
MNRVHLSELKWSFIWGMLGSRLWNLKIRDFSFGQSFKNLKGLGTRRDRGHSSNDCLNKLNNFWQAKNAVSSSRIVQLKIRTRRNRKNFWYYWMFWPKLLCWFFYVLLFRLIIICETRTVIGRNKTFLPSLSKSSKNVNPTQSTTNSCLEFPFQALLGLVRIRITQSNLGIQSPLNIKPSSEYGPGNC